MSDIFKNNKELEKDLKNHVLKTLKTDGFEIECSFCQTQFVAKTIKAVCPNCSKTTEITFNFK